MTAVLPAQRADGRPGAAGDAPALRLRAAERGPGAAYRLGALSRRMISPLCGLDQSVGFMVRSRSDPRMVVSGGHLTGVHLLHGMETAGAYHIGGSGVFREEALIRTFGETVERYSGLVASLDPTHETRFASMNDLAAAGEPFVRMLPQFVDAQYTREGFPFVAPTDDAPFTWVRARSLTEGGDVWVPAQLVFIGYTMRRDDGEPWVYPAVTTGSAAHVSMLRAIRGGLTEMVQIDAAMGHWYSPSVAPRIELDARVPHFRALLERYFASSSLRFSFHWLPAPGFDVFNVACVVRAPDGGIPAVAAGLGSDLRLEDALYKALLEGTAAAQLARTLRVLPTLVGVATPRDPKDITKMFDLDANVAYYARPENTGRVDRKFPDERGIDAADLPPDLDVGTAEGVASVLESFRAQGLTLTALDCTTDDVRRLGFRAVRLWSPDLMSVCLPSTPPLAHPRLARYGGAQDVGPHPYP